MPFLCLPNEIILQIAESLIPCMDPPPPTPDPKPYVRRCGRGLHESNIYASPVRAEKRPYQGFPEDLNNLYKACRQLSILLAPVLSSLVVHYKDHILIWAAKKGYESPVKAALEVGPSEEAKTRALLWAAGGGHESVIKILLGNGIKVDLTDSPRGKTALHWAADRGHEHIVKLLLYCGANIDAEDLTSGPHRCTALYSASRRGHEGVVKLLLERGANIKSVDEDEGVVNKGVVKGALGAAAMNCHKSIVHLLLRKHALCEDCADQATYAILWAAYGGDCSIMSLLVEYGADPKRSRNAFSETPLHFAVRGGNIDAVKWLLDKGVAATKDHTVVTPLEIAVKRGYDGVLKLLLEHRAFSCGEISDISKNLHEAVARGYGTIVTTLLDSGIDINSRDYVGNTALHYAVGAHLLPMVTLLLERGADINAADGSQHTPLHNAIGNQSMVETLLKKGALVDSMCLKGRTPLFLAVLRDDHFSTKLLLQNGADPNHRDNFGKSALHLTRTSPALFETLLDSGADIHAVDSSGVTVLHQVLQHPPFDRSFGGNYSRLGDPESVEFLSLEARIRLCLERGVDINIMDNTGRTAFDVAMSMRLDLEVFHQKRILEAREFC